LIMIYYSNNIHIVLLDHRFSANWVDHIANRLTYSRVRNFILDGCHYAFIIACDMINIIECTAEGDATPESAWMTLVFDSGIAIGLLKLLGGKAAMQIVSSSGLRCIARNRVN
jgi:hypothetical protein